jgi:hypothetical protein
MWRGSYISSHTVIYIVLLAKQKRLDDIKVASFVYFLIDFNNRRLVLVLPKRQGITVCNGRRGNLGRFVSIILESH